MDFFNTCTSFCLRKKVKVGLLFLAIFIIIAITIDDGITKKNAPNCQTKKPLCIDGILQRERRPPGVNTPPVLLTDGEDPYQLNRDCRLHHYTKADVTACIDELSYRRAKHKEPVHIAFIGESILRHQFLNFIRWIPDFDLSMKTKPTPKAQYHFHEDRDVTSEALNLRLSFYWRPLANEELIATFREWNTPPYRSTPDYIITGMIFNHMDALRNDNNYTSFAIGLTKLKPILQELTNVTRVVWMQQAPIVDASNTEHYIFHSFLAKVHRYNAGMREILAGSDVEIWDSIDPVAMQYVRSCSMLERNGNHIWRFCSDAIHTGYVTLEHSAQVTWNDLCNRVLIPMDQ